MPYQLTDQIDEMSLSTIYKEKYPDYLDEADALIKKSFGNIDKQLPTSGVSKLRKHIVDSMIKAEKSDWFFSSKGRDEFFESYGFDYPWITEFEQQQWQHSQTQPRKKLVPEDMDIREMDIETLRSRKLGI